MRKARIALALGVGVALSAAAAQSSDKAAQLDDIAAFRREVLMVDPAFTPAAHQVAERRLTALETRAQSGVLTDASLGAALCQVAALADNGHSNCILETLGLPRIPIFISPLGDGLVVVASDQADADLLGARFVGVDGHTAAEVQRAARSLAGGVTGYRDIESSGLYSRPALLHALGLARSPDAATYRLRLQDGRTVIRKLEAGPAGPPAKPPPSPWANQDNTARFRWIDAPAHDAVVVQIRRNENAPDVSLPALLAEVEKRRAALGRRDVIFDLRADTGGDMLLTRDFMLAWPRSLGPEGRFVVLIGPRTFSAGIATAAYLKQAGGDRVTFAGQPVGDRMTFFGENHMAKLPHSGLVISVATARDDLAGGCKAYVDCFAGLAQPGAATGSPPRVAAAIARVPLEVPNLGPDIPAALDVADWLAGRDPVMAAALRALEPCRQGADCAAESKALAGG